ncbi:MAG: flagellar biosynthesis anti-sigma factor FlgM [Thermodesulfobacteriota bacterium]
MKINEYISGTKTNGYAGEVKPADQEGRPKAQAGSASEAGSVDKVNLSDRSREIARAQELVRDAPEFRAEKVAEIKAGVEAGTYKVNSLQTADKILRSIIDEVV